ncbi:MAG: hypothetical protein P1V35_06585 [Planctomycetota bacterium]|nr:hypothetical protein [Planctomycetota bacterium]
MAKSPIIRPERWREPDETPPEEPAVQRESESVAARPRSQPAVEPKGRSSILPLALMGLFMGVLLAGGIGYVLVTEGSLLDLIRKPPVDTAKVEAPPEVVSNLANEVEEQAKEPIEIVAPKPEPKPEPIPLPPAKPEPVFDRESVLEAISKLETECLRASGSRQDIKDAQSDIRAFRSTAGLEDAIVLAEASIRQSRLRLDQYLDRACNEAAQVMNETILFPEEVNRVLQSELGAAQSQWKTERINGIKVIIELVSSIPRDKNQFEGHARRGLQPLFTQ